MADTPDHPGSPSDDAFDETGQVPVEEEAVETPAPRRAASAQFSVESDVGSEALLREAMDPANESLADALRLSFRVLQVVILVLIVLFVFSGFQTVEEGQSGVLLRWGKILEVDDQLALEPGLKFSRWPYPAGEFVLFDDRDRTVDLGNMYFQQLKQGETLAEAIQSASVHQQLRPGRDGSVLTSGGDIAHVRLSGRYDIDAPEQFVYHVEDSNRDPSSLDADRLVSLAMQRAVVHIAARRSLQDFVDMSDGGKEEIRDTAQSLLDQVNSGIRLASVDTPLEPTPAFAIRKSFNELQEARIVAEEQVKNARSAAVTRLQSVAGNSYQALIQRIGAYEEAHELGDEDRAEALLLEINSLLENNQTSGEVKTRLARAESYRETIDSTLGREASRFENVRTRFLERPRWVISQLWTEAYNGIFEQDDVEVIRVPEDGSVLNILVTGLDHVRETRRKQKLDRQQAETYGGALGFENPYIPRARDLREGPGRQLDAEGRPIER